MRNKVNQPASREKIHFIEEWSERRGLKRADIARELGADPSLVSRWFAGNIPSEKWLQPLADLLQVDRSSLFRDPDDDWIARLFRDKTEQQKEAAIEMLRIFFRQQEIESTDSRISRRSGGSDER